MESNADQFYFFTRWGRVGFAGQMAEMGPTNSQGAIASYEKKKREKMNGGYTLVEMNYESDKK
jgi:predicted DNA-binding WGR domain protein